MCVQHIVDRDNRRGSGRQWRLQYQGQQGDDVGKQLGVIALSGPAAPVYIGWPCWSKAAHDSTGSTAPLHKILHSSRPSAAMQPITHDGFTASCAWDGMERMHMITPSLHETCATPLADSAFCRPLYATTLLCCMQQPCCARQVSRQCPSLARRYLKQRPFRPAHCPDFAEGTMVRLASCQNAVNTVVRSASCCTI